MIDQIANINLSFLKELIKDKNRSAKQMESLNNYLIENGCTWKGAAMPTLLKPNFITIEQSNIIQYYVNNISVILKKMIDLYIKDNELKNFFNFSKIENEMFLVDPDYTMPLVVSRLDAFMNDKDLKFVEFNCDSPAGAAYADILEKGFKNIIDNSSSLSKWNYIYDDRQLQLLNSLIESYNEFRTKHKYFPEKPNIAIVDWADVITSSEFEILKSYFKLKGYNTIITSPQNFEIKNNSLIADDIEIHLIYKRVIVRELIEKFDEVETFIHAIKEKFACTCNSFRTNIAGNKKILAALNDKRFQNILTKEELKVIQKTIPWTSILYDKKVTLQGYTINLKEFVCDNKDKLVIKPAASYGGKDVYLGKETDQLTWENLINSNIDSQNWVVQEYISIPEEFFPVIKDNNVFIELKKVNINPFAFSGSYSGTISRISDSSIINVSQGGGIVPSISFS